MKKNKYSFTFSSNQIKKAQELAVLMPLKKSFYKNPSLQYIKLLKKTQQRG